MSPTPLGWRGWTLLAVMCAFVTKALWQWSAWAAGAFAVVCAAGALSVYAAQRRARRRGYWIEYLSPNQVRGGSEQFAIVYHEGEQEIWFNGLVRSPRERDLLHFPGAEAWTAAVDAWARERRSEILERLREDAIVRRCDLVEREPA
ncbi:MAG: hypothetical protein FJ299_10055 [Planctomycetes bacterium]|nr:hypothetical protein [Planctomycetota bacterium]